MRVVAYRCADDCKPGLRWVAYNDVGGEYAPVRHFGETKELAVSRAEAFWKAQQAKIAREREGIASRAAAHARRRKASEQASPEAAVSA